MNVENFIRNLIQIKDIKPEKIDIEFQRLLYESNDEDLSCNVQEVSEWLEKLGSEDSASLGVKLGRCLSNCETQQKNLSSDDGTAYAQKIKTVYNLLKDLVAIFYDVQEKRATKNIDIKTSFEQHKAIMQEIKAEQSILKDEFNELSDSVINSTMEKLNEVVANADKKIDEKMFQLLTNTVSILGIFVAIAFTGFSVTTLFSKIDFEAASASPGSFIKSVFFLVLVSWLSYNLLLLLVYFVYKLSRPLKEPSTNETQESFSRTIKLEEFFTVDVWMGIIVLALFVWCQYL